MRAEWDFLRPGPVTLHAAGSAIIIREIKSMSPTEHVVLVDELNAVLGTTPKAEVHHESTPLHRGFSLFMFNRRGEVLSQQRSAQKKIFPLVWTDSASGHPQLGETNEAAAKRRVRQELGMELASAEEVAPYRYEVLHNGILENEICPILVGFTDGDVGEINRDEIAAVRWTNWSNFRDDMEAHPACYSPWCLDAARMLDEHPRFEELRNMFTASAHAPAVPHA